MKMYIVAQAHNLTALEEEVNDLLGKGYVPSGSMSMIGGEEWTLYAQPMIHITMTMTWGERNSAASKALREGRVG